VAGSVGIAAPMPPEPARAGARLCRNNAYGVFSRRPPDETVSELTCAARPRTVGFLFALAGWGAPHVHVCLSPGAQAFPEALPFVSNRRRQTARTSEGSDRR